ncbi:MAG: MTH1187 family thiamine-binding protein [Nitrososphaeria archaeon]|nr:MTH1187 family thiamine-binding protein [Conexivisphaerales archaeon]
MSVIVEIAIDPIGTNSTSVSGYIRKVVEAIEKMNLKYQVGPMGTSFELKSVKQLGDILQTIHDELNKQGINRIVTTVRIDDRRDKEETMEYKVSRVVKK